MPTNPLWEQSPYRRQHAVRTMRMPQQNPTVSSASNREACPARSRKPALAKLKDRTAEHVSHSAGTPAANKYAHRSPAPTASTAQLRLFVPWTKDFRPFRSEPGSGGEPIRRTARAHRCHRPADDEIGGKLPAEEPARRNGREHRFRGRNAGSAHGYADRIPPARRAIDRIRPRHQRWANPVCDATSQILAASKSVRDPITSAPHLPNLDGLSPDGGHSQAFDDTEFGRRERVHTSVAPMSFRWIRRRYR